MVPTRLVSVVFAAAAAQPAPVATLRDLGPALSRCFVAPPHSVGSQITVLLSLKSDGSVLGTPRITFSQLVGGPAEQKAFVTAVLDGLDRCTPVRLTPSLGGAVAGRPFSLRFVGGGKAVPI
jgi:hypothetical protein